MQTLVQVFCSKGQSLRTKIINDGKLGDFQLTVDRTKKVGKSHGWSKLKGGSGEKGAINIEWDSKTRALVCRVINRGSGKPNDIIANFVRYLLARCRPRIEGINILYR